MYYLLNRDTPKNNYRKARKHHKIAEKLYEEGEGDLAQYHYDLANSYRERAKGD
jgi:hypothetical protein